jgi:rhamnosyltransferase
MKKIAVLLASHNGKKYIKEQIDSILNQEKVNITIFVSDDSSTDYTIEYVQNIYENNEKLIYLENNQKFGGAAKNFYRLIRDVDFLKFDYISFSDQDDIWYKDKLARAITVIEEKQVDAYSSNILAFWEDGRKKIIKKSQRQVKYDYLFESAGPGCSYVLSQKLAQEIRIFIIRNWQYVNQISLHDWLIYAISREKGYQWYIDEAITIKYRQHSHNQIGINYGINAKIKRLKLIYFSWYRQETSKILKVLNIECKYKFSKLILEKTYFNNILLIKYVFNFRRRIREKIFFLILLLFGIY